MAQARKRLAYHPETEDQASGDGMREKKEGKESRRKGKGHRSDDNSLSSIDSGEGMASITSEDLYNTGGLLSNSRPGSPVVTSNHKKRMSMPLGISSMTGQKKLTNSLLNLSPHRRRPSLQTRSLSSGGAVTAGGGGGNNVGGTGLSPASPSSSLKSAVSATSSTSTLTLVPSGSPTQQHQHQHTPTTSSNLASLETSREPPLETSPSTSETPVPAKPQGADRSAMNDDSPTVPNFDTGSPLSAPNEGKFERRYAQSYPLTAAYEDEWDSDAAVAEDEEEDGEHGTKKIAASRRILSPNTPIEEEPLLASGESDDRFPDYRLEPSRGVSITDLRAKARSNSTTSSRSYFGLDKSANVTPVSAADLPRRGGTVSFEVHTPKRVPSDTSLNQSVLSDPPSRPGSVPPRSGLPRASSTRSIKDTDSNSTSSSLRVSSLNQIAALKQQMANQESQPPKSSSSNSSSEALSVASKAPSRKGSAFARSAEFLNKKYPPSIEPPLPDPLAPKVDPAPSSGMYWYKTLSHGFATTPFRAHSCTLVGSSIYVFGGCDPKSCFNDLYVFDADSMYWSKPAVQGDIPPPLRAMTTTAVGKKLVIFGGGDGPTYYNDLYVLDTVTHRYTKPKVSGTLPSKRRAHTACLYKNGLYVFGGGDGVRALNDVWRLDVNDMNKLNWKLISSATSSTSLKGTGRSPAGASATSLLAVTNSSSSRPASSSVSSSSSGRVPTSSPTATLKLKPTARGYHTANMVQNKLIIFGGSDGVECFRDVWVFDVETNVWKCVEIKTSYPRLSHTATIIGSYLFVVGGHDGVDYSSEVLLLNLVTMQWDRRKVYGRPPSGRGYHGAVLHDSRLFIIGGFDGHSVFNDTYILELAVSSYYSQISHFTIEV